MGKKTEQQEPENEQTAQVDTTQAEKNAAEEFSLEEQLRNELTQALDKIKVQQEQYLRTLADMENLRKRTQREKEELAKFANENILREILPVMDNLERAIEHADQAENGEGLLEGVQMTLTQFSQVLSRFGVEPVEAMGQPFDPALHQAMGQMESADHPVNTVVQQMQKGYQLNERLLRPAFVMVAKAPTALAPEPEEQNQNTTTELDEEQNDF
ncbi:MAG: nucleotide exchange factor GrpE [Deltaproteobacteria bacterium]|nr:nucleotide exchange factor GrpE [Deltaproteobacteria bacterium]MCW8892861.1 nucleotide exchange factor GrpE [Deltaproteobacteria bacterium]